MEHEDYAPFTLADEARAWITTNGPEAITDSCAPWMDSALSTDAAVMRFVGANYPGGVMGFAADAYEVHGYHVIAATLRQSIEAR